MTTDDVQDLIRNSITARERKAEENRKAFPYAAELMDQFAEFDPKLIYAEENGRSIGKRPDKSNSLDGDRLVQMHDSFEFIKSRMRKKR
jgi:hypothetical protein